MDNKTKFKTLVIIDLETTGLIDDEPKITELAMIAVNIATLEGMKADDELPRVSNKFVKLFNPLKLISGVVAEITGLNNRMLMDYAPFSRETVVAMEAFLSDLQKPMCFVAHNGNPFDFPILFEEIRCALSNPAPCMNNNSNNCTDEMEAIIPNDNIPVSSLPTNGSSLQTTSTDIYLTSLLSIECADSLVFFREMQQSINDKNTSQHEINNIPSESLVISNQNGCNNNALTDPMELTSSPVRSTNNNNSSSLHGYGKMPSAYIPSPDPARPQPSMKLVKIYEREFHQKTSHFKSHRAEDDCLMLLAILKRYLPAWLEWIAMNHKPLSNFFSLSCTTSKNIHRKLL